jgi:hypothetical protein
MPREKNVCSEIESSLFRTRVIEKILQKLKFPDVQKIHNSQSNLITYGRVVSEMMHTLRKGTYQIRTWELAVNECITVKQGAKKVQ